MLGFQGFLYADDPGSYTSSPGGNRLRGSGRSGISVRVLLVLVQAPSQRRREEKQYEGSVMSRAGRTVGETLGLV
jgi:hypothetical protein